jgi:hypothetical protein
VEIASGFRLLAIGFWQQPDNAMIKISLSPEYFCHKHGTEIKNNDCRGQQPTTNNQQPITNNL